MAIELIPRKLCPACEARTHVVYQLPFSNRTLKKYLADFYTDRAILDVFDAEIYQFRKCQRCDFLFQGYVLNDEGQAALYGEWVDNEKSLQKKRQAGAKLYRQYAGQLEIISRIFSQPPHELNILEYGMGWGYWSRMAKAFGYRVSGLELSPERIEHGIKLGVDVIDALPASNSNYDFIYANQVFEHLPNPLETLRQLSEQLKPGGVIYLRVPDGRGIERRLRKKGWSSDLDAVHPFEHINCFNRRTLCAMASEAGLSVMQPPLRVDLSRFWGGMKREVNDRWLTTHVYFRKG